MIRPLVFAALVTLTFGIQDFDDSGNPYIEYIYHDAFDLLLAASNRSCYYVYIADNYNTEHKYLEAHRYNTEKYVTMLIYHKHLHTDIVQPSDLDTVRTRFQDLLADFRCQNKSIYTINLDLEDVHIPTTHQPNNHHHQNQGSHHGN